MKSVKAFLMLAIATILTFTVSARELNIVPQPTYINIEETGDYVVTAKTRVILDVAHPNPAYRFVEDLSHIYGVMKVAKRGKGITLSVDNSLHNEGYTITTTAEGIAIVGGSEAGMYYGLQTLRQIIITNEGRVPYGVIRDEPSFDYRGAHLDVSRHFFSVADVKRYIDILAAHKLNRLHWHLTDDQGWRIEIKAYPELIDKGSMRKETLIGHGLEPKWWDGEPYGGYYTQAEIRDIVEYASSRYITIIPEIEMPGHSQAALHALPWLGCQEQDVEVWTMWGVTPEVLCAGKESTYTFLENVLKEVIDLFPSELIHIGGDECPKDRWKECEHCQAMMKAQGLENEEELQGYLVTRIEKFLNGHGRRIIGWDEILEGGVTPTATVMAWRGAKIGAYAAEHGHEVVMVPLPICYFDFYQTESREGEGLHIGGHINFEKVYSWDPFEGISEEARKNIIGVQCNLWSEYLKNLKMVEIQLLPRLGALSEVQWSVDRRNEDTIRQKMESMRKLYDAYGWHYAPYYFEGRK
ncbi:MAG: beta-N-acetylhexosaminidase [Alistipes sp.]|nr:beta-N-acetylhexosaminidase [Alistipes sp.]